MGRVCFFYTLFVWCRLEAVCARFKIDKDRFDDFFRTCLRRTLAQMLCDARRKRREAGRIGNRPDSANGSPQPSPVTFDDQEPYSGASIVSRANGNQLNRNILD